MVIVMMAETNHAPAPGSNRGGSGTANHLNDNARWSRSGFWLLGVPPVADLSMSAESANRCHRCRHLAPRPWRQGISRFSNATLSLPSGFDGGGSHEYGSHGWMDDVSDGSDTSDGWTHPQTYPSRTVDGSDTSDGLSAVVPYSTGRLDGSRHTPEHA